MRMKLSAKATGLPVVLARSPLGTFNTKYAERAYAHPRPQLMRLTRSGLLHRLADGFYVVVPHELAASSEWMPILEAAAGGVAAAEFGPGIAPLMGLSAARMHGVVPRASAVATVAAPRRRRTLQLSDRVAEIRFSPRSLSELDVELMPSELGPVLVTTPEQTVLDLAHRPARDGDPTEVTSAIRLLLPRCRLDALASLAAQQNLVTALKRAQTLVEG